MTIGKKISKRDQLESTAEELAEEAARQKRLATPSKHFSVGTGIKVAHRPPGIILARHTDSSGTHLTVQWDDGSVSLITPYALNRSTT